VWCCFVIPCLAVLVELRLVTDRQTDTDTESQTDTGPWLYRGCIASRGKNGDDDEIHCTDGRIRTPLTDFTAVRQHFVDHGVPASPSYTGNDVIVVLRCRLAVCP